MELERGKVYSADAIDHRISGIYLFVGGSGVLYVGQSQDMITRLRSHHFGFGIQVLVIPCETSKLSKLERELILEFDPPYNKESYKSEFEVIDYDDLWDWED